MAYVEPLKKELRNQLEKVVKAARQEAEEGAQAVLEQYAVSNPQPFEHLSTEERDLRRRLRAHARQLGDQLLSDGQQTINHLIHECAYEHWHEMLFARFLAENNLLMHPEGVPVSLEECGELATEEGVEDGWEMASRYAAHMLPQIFRPDAPVFQLTLSPECRHLLEELLESLPAEVFTASDSLGWVYQFWQAQKKDEVNQSEVKIGADELPAVTQLFTESYMVDFLLHNSLGAWWVSRHPDKELSVEMPYLRRLEDGTPAAGTFPGWPDTTRELKVLDPCCGSGHFLVAAFQLLVPLRMAEEGLPANDACEAVLSENLYGLEIDERCTQIAAFALALAAWTYPGAGGYRLLSELHIACSGLAVGAKEQEWVAFAGESEKLREGMKRLHGLFKDAPVLGSLIDPAGDGGDLLTAGFEELRPLFQQAIEKEKQDYAGNELGITARGIARAAEFLAAKYHLIVTNVPYLVRGKQAPKLRDFCEIHYPTSKNDLATVFLERCLKMCAIGGTTSLVIPQNWLFLMTYRKMREHLLQQQTWNILARLGPKAFQTPMWDFNVQLLSLSHLLPPDDHSLHGLDASAPRTTVEKAALLRKGKLMAAGQKGQLGNPDARLMLEEAKGTSWLSEIADYGKGSTTGDAPRFLMRFWELPKISDQNVLWLNSPVQGCPWSGRSNICIEPLESPTLTSQFGCWLRGHGVWNRRGVVVNKMSTLEPFLYSGEVFDDNICPICPQNASAIPAIWAYVKSDGYRDSVRAVDQALKVTAATLVKVPFDLEYWQKIANEKYPNGLPQPYSDDSTQWLFHGFPAKSTSPLHISVARLLGYQWPAESDEDMELASKAREWVTRCKDLDSLADDDGIVCIPAVRGEQPAYTRLETLLAKAYGDQWNTALRESLLNDVGYDSKSLDDWLRDGFFEQHCQLFHQRPFIWHIWDGRRRDGFGALVNYHKLDRRRLETLTYTYLGDWIRRQEDGLKQNIGGAEARLLAAQQLQEKLQLILEGEDPYDIFVRWKPLEEQSIGWGPDLNDGVRLNIRPFIIADVLRKKPKIKWNKDRGKDPADAPWGIDRINDRHLSLAEKQAARDKSRA
jgi:hypothetical protein